MQPIKSLLSAGESLIDRALCVLGAIAFSQAPEFMQQYLQRLGGHLAEAHRQLAQFENVARQAGKSLHELVVQYSASADSSVAALGRLMGEAQLRVDDLTAAESALRGASLVTRPFVFLRHLDVEIVRGTSSAFRPAVPTTVEGLLYALVGIAIILGVYHGLVCPLVRRLWNRTNRQPPKGASRNQAGASRSA